MPDSRQAAPCEHRRAGRMSRHSLRESWMATLRRRAGRVGSLFTLQRRLAALRLQGWKIDACPAPLTHEGHPVRAGLERYRRSSTMSDTWQLCACRAGSRYTYTKKVQLQATLRGTGLEGMALKATVFVSRIPCTKQSWRVHGQRTREPLPGYPACQGQKITDRQIGLLGGGNPARLAGLEGVSRH